MVDINFILSKEIEIFAFREKQYSAFAMYLSKSNDEIDLELVKHYNALVDEYQHLISVYAFLNEGLDLDFQTSEIISEIYLSLANNYKSLSVTFNSLDINHPNSFWSTYLKDYYLHLADGYSKEALTFKYFI